MILSFTRKHKEKRLTSRNFCRSFFFSSSWCKSESNWYFCNVSAATLYHAENIEGVQKYNHLLKEKLQLGKLTPPFQMLPTWNWCLRDLKFLKETSKLNIPFERNFHFLLRGRLSSIFVFYLIFSKQLRMFWNELWNINNQRCTQINKQFRRRAKYKLPLMFLRRSFVLSSTVVHWDL